MKLLKESIPCKFEHHFTDWVPMPFGPGNCDMPGFECTFEGDESLAPAIETMDECSPGCPGYKPVKVAVCEKHNVEYYDYCGDCEEEGFTGKKLPRR